MAVKKEDINFDVHAKIPPKTEKQVKSKTKRKLIATVKDLYYGCDLSKRVRKDIVDKNCLNEVILDNLLSEDGKNASVEVQKAVKQHQEYERDNTFHIWGWTWYQSLMWFDAIREYLDQKVEEYFEEHLFSKDGRVIIPKSMVVSIEEEKQ